MWGALLRVWMVDLLVAMRVLPLQAMSLVVITLPWTLPRLLALQLATAASVVEGAGPNPKPKTLQPLDPLWMPTLLLCATCPLLPASRRGWCS